MRAPIVLGVLVTAAAMAVTTASRAQAPTIVSQPPAPSTMAPVPTAEEAVGAPGPNRLLLGTGLGMFAASYIPSVIVAGSSNVPADQKLYIPVAGPWMDLAQRPACGPAGPACNFDMGNKVLLAASGAAQGLGVLATVASFFVPQPQKVVTTAATRKPTIHVSPQVGAGGAGVAAFGTW